MAGPDLTAVGAAFGRAAHVLLDERPHVLDDTLSIRLADDGTLRAAQLLARAGSSPRATIPAHGGVARSRPGHASSRTWSPSISRRACRSS